MTGLARQQAALLEALFAQPAQPARDAIAACIHDPAGRGLQVYQANGHLLAERALHAAYPVLRQMLGDDSFADLARALWHAQVPQLGDMGRWGGSLAAFVEGNDQLADVPYLGDIARLEWLLHSCASAADQAGDPASLALLTTHDPQQLHLRLAPGCAVLVSAWPVASLLLAHLDGEPTLETAARRLHERQPEAAVVWRQGLRPQARLAGPGEAALLQALLAGASLSLALDGAAELDFSAWFLPALECGLVLGVAPLDADLQ